MSRAHTTPDLTDAYREQCYKMQQCPHCGAQDCITTTTERKKISRALAHHHKACLPGLPVCRDVQQERGCIMNPEIPIINGKQYPLWSGFVDKNDWFVGGILIVFDLMT